MLKAKEIDMHFTNVDDGIWTSQSGAFYFVDETEDFVGPYATKELALASLTSYIEFLKG